MRIVQGYIPDDKRPYVYGIFFPEQMGGSCFYVGKGQGERVLHHGKASADKTRNRAKQAALASCDGREIRRIFSYFELDSEALAYETALILFLPGLLNKKFPARIQVPRMRNMVRFA